MSYLLWLLPLLALLAVVGYLFARSRLSVPRLSYIPLPPYEVPNIILVGGLLVENRGRATAPNVKIEINYDQSDAIKIQHMHVASDEPYILRGGGEQYNFATIRLRELRPRRRVFVYWAAGDEFRPRITVTSFQQQPTSPQTGLVGGLRNLLHI